MEPGDDMGLPAQVPGEPDAAYHRRTIGVLEQRVNIALKRIDGMSSALSTISDEIHHVAEDQRDARHRVDGLVQSVGDAEARILRAIGDRQNETCRAVVAAGGTTVRAVSESRPLSGAVLVVAVAIALRILGVTPDRIYGEGYGVDFSGAPQAPVPTPQPEP